MITIREAVKADITEILECRHQAIYTKAVQHYSAHELEEWVGKTVGSKQAAYEKSISDPEIIFQVAEDENGKIIGFGNIIIPDNEFKNLYSSVLGRKVGVMLMQRLENQAKQRGVKFLTLRSSLNAYEFYLSQGYVSEGRIMFKMPSGLDIECVNMRKIIMQSYT